MTPSWGRGVQHHAGSHMRVGGLSLDREAKIVRQGGEGWFEGVVRRRVTLDKEAFVQLGEVACH